MPDKLELIIVFGLIALTDTYFLVDSIVRKIDEISETSLDKQIELVKVEKGIYSVAKREETTNIKQHDALVEEFEQLKAENERLVNELIEQQKLFTKLIVAKNLEIKWNKQWQCKRNFRIIRRNQSSSNQLLYKW